jgi:hypothetical protein
MEAFYKIVILVLIVFLIIVLTIIGILLGKTTNSLVYPPVANQCPDYWTYDGSYCIVPDQGVYGKDVTGKTYTDVENSKPLNGVHGGVKTLTTTNTPGLIIDNDDKKKLVTLKVDFKNSGWTGVCDQKKWAQKYNIAWDGVSNYNSC